MIITLLLYTIGKTRKGYVRKGAEEEQRNTKRKPVDPTGFRGEKSMKKSIK